MTVASGGGGSFCLYAGACRMFSNVPPHQQQLLSFGATEFTPFATPLSRDKHHKCTWTDSQPFIAAIQSYIHTLSVHVCFDSTASIFGSNVSSTNRIPMPNWLLDVCTLLINAIAGRIDGSLTNGTDRQTSRFRFDGASFRRCRSFPSARAAAVATRTNNNPPWQT